MIGPSESTVTEFASSALKAAGMENWVPKETQSTFVVLDIDLDAPVGILPQSTDRTDYLVADLGTAKVLLRCFLHVFESFR